MTDIYELPNNAENYHRKGLAYLERLQLAKAMDAFENSLELQYSDDVFDELVKLYLSLKQSEALEQLWQKYFPTKDTIYQNERILFLYAMSVPYIHSLDRALIELYQLKEHVMNQGWATEYLDQLISEWIHIKNIQEKITTLNSDQEIEKIIQQLYENGPLELLVQLKKLYDLPISDNYKLFEQILATPNIENYIKSDILHYFIEKRHHSQLDLYWFGEKFQIDTANLKLYKTHPTYLEGIALIQQYCERENPHLLEDITQQFTLQSMIFYPFIEKVINHPKDWLTLFLYSNQLSDQPLSKTNEDLLTYVQKANIELNQILQF